MMTDVLELKRQMEMLAERLMLVSAMSIDEIEDATPALIQIFGELNETLDFVLLGKQATRLAAMIPMGTA